MSICPQCGHINIEGVDICEQCEQSLSFMYRDRPVTSLEHHISKDRIAQLPPREPLLVEAGAPVSLVIKLIYDHSVGCAIVVDADRRPIGIFSERDVLMRLNADAAAQGDRPVSDFMTPDPETLEEKDKIAFALHKMDLGGFRHIPITSSQRVTGVVSVRDVLQYITKRLHTA